METETVAFWRYMGAALATARTKAGLEAKDIHTPLEKQHRSNLKRWENRAAYPKDIDRLVAAYSRETGRSVIDLWADAVRLARRDEKLDELKTTFVTLGPPHREVEAEARRATEGLDPDQS